jgi:1,4-alpha-glucan branching enzyme
VAQAARQLLLAQSSDWQFMISTGAVPDYAERRFNLHCRDLEVLLAGLSEGAPAQDVERGRELAAELEDRDSLFPDILTSVRSISDEG